jgi:hypothetical protein
MRGGLVLAVAALALVGCGGGKGNIKGKVYYKDKPLSSGVVAFVAKGKAFGPCTIKEDGSYSITNVPAGEVTITVTGTSSASGKPNEKTVQIPMEYSDPAKSKKKYTVTAGDQEYDIKLD